MAVETPNEVLVQGGEGYVLIAPAGTATEDFDTESVNYCAISWDGSEAVDEQDSTTTCNFNEDTGLVNDEMQVTGTHLEGTLRFHHNPNVDIRATFRPGQEVVARLCLSRGRAAVVGPPAVTGIKRTYYDVPRLLLRQLGITGGGAKEWRGFEFGFRSQGTYDYVNETAI